MCILCITYSASPNGEHNKHKQEIQKEGRAGGCEEINHLHHHYHVPATNQDVLTVGTLEMKEEQWNECAKNRTGNCDTTVRDEHFLQL